MDRATKEQVIADMREKLQRAQVAVITDFKGMSVEKMTDLRNRLYEQRIDYHVVKNTLMRIATRETDYEAMGPLLKGTNAVALCYDDPGAPARILKKYLKDNKDFEIKGGVIGNRLLNAEEVLRLSDLPTREELLAKLLSVMIGVPTKLVSVLGQAADAPGALVRVLAGVPRSFVSVLAAIKDQREQG